MSPYDWRVRQPEVDRDRFAELLRELLALRQMTPLELAERAGVDETTIYRWRSKKLGVQPGNVVAVARAVGYDPILALQRVGFFTADEVEGTVPSRPAWGDPPDPQALEFLRTLLQRPDVSETVKRLALSQLAVATDAVVEIARSMGVDDIEAPRRQKKPS